MALSVRAKGRITRGMRAPVLLFLLFASCAAGVTSLTPGRLVDVPGDDDAGVGLSAARQMVERGEVPAALQQLESVLSLQPENVDGRRLRQDLLRGRGRVGLLRAESEALLKQRPDDAISHYLAGRIAPTEAQKLEQFEAAVKLAPESLWPWLGLAYALRDSDPNASLSIYQRLYTETDRLPIVAVALASTLRMTGAYDLALPVYEALRQDRSQPGVGDLGIAQTLTAMGKQQQAWAPLMSALRQRPRDPGVHQLLSEWLRGGLADEAIEQVLDLLREDPSRLAALQDGDGAPMLLYLLQHSLRPQAARTLLQRAEISSRHPALRRAWRRLLLSTGDLPGFLRAVQQDYPAPLLQDEGNQVRGRWLQLFEGPWSQGDPLADAAQATALVVALRDCGLLWEAEEVAATALGRFQDQGLEDAIAEVQAEMAFEGGLRRIVYQGYQRSDVPDLEQVLSQLRQLSQMVFGRDVVGKTPTFAVAMVGEVVDPFKSDLGHHLARYNHHLVLGERSGGPVEGLLLTRLSLRELPDDAALPLPGRCFEVIGDNRELRSLSGVAGGDLAGVALLNHYVVDLDSVREWADAIEDRRRTSQADGDVLLRDPLPRQVGELEPLGVSWRLSVLSPVQDSDLDDAVLDTIRRHERAHLVDSFYFLPIEANLLRAMGLLLRFGPSPSAIESEMERRAELAALAQSPHTRLVLSHIADFLEDLTSEAPHASGFRRLASDLVTGLRRKGVPPEDCVASRWHRLDPELVRQVAQQLLERSW